MTSRRKRRADKHPWAGQPISRRSPVPGGRKRRPIAALTPTLLLPAALVAGSAPFLAPAEENAEPPRELGASGELPQQQAPSPELLHHADRPDELRERAAADEEIPEDLDIPQPVLAGYRAAADELQRSHPQCRMGWSLLASVGRIESAHARGGAVDADGTTLDAILGPRLSGGEGVAAVRDTDGGRYDGDPVWDRAVGPMQFIPGTWEKYATDGNGDGVADPHNVHDASAAAGEYLCSGGRDVSDPEQAAEAVFSYNRSDEYVRTVLVWADAYERGVLPTRVDPPPASRGDVLAGQRLPADDSPLAIPDLPPVDEHPVDQAPIGGAPAAGTGAAPPPQDPAAVPVPGADSAVPPAVPGPGASEPPAADSPTTESPAAELPEVLEEAPTDPGAASPSPPQIDPPASPEPPELPELPGPTGLPSEQPPADPESTTQPSGSPGPSAPGPAEPDTPAIPAPTSPPQASGESSPDLAPPSSPSRPEIAPLTGTDPIPRPTPSAPTPPEPTPPEPTPSVPDTAGPGAVDPGALRACEADVLRTGEFALIPSAQRGPVEAARPGEVVWTGQPDFRQPCRVPESYRP